MGATGETGLSGLTGSTGLSGATGALCLLLVERLNRSLWCHGKFALLQ